MSLRRFWKESLIPYQKRGLKGQVVIMVMRVYAVYKPREDEIRAAIKLLKNGKAPGVDKIATELLKLGEETVVQWLTQLAVSIWQSESVPEDWVKQLTIPLHKKGAHDHCDNFRSIALLSIPGKVFCRVIQKR